MAKKNNKILYILLRGSSKGGKGWMLGRQHDLASLYCIGKSNNCPCSMPNCKPRSDRRYV
eukprot:1850257-Amphidinium_carterae.1